MAQDRYPLHQRDCHFNPRRSIPLETGALDSSSILPQSTAGRRRPTLLHAPPRFPVLPLPVRSMGHNNRLVISTKFQYFLTSKFNV